jgi:hypothetical protein
MFILLVLPSMSREFAGIVALVIVSAVMFKSGKNVGVPYGNLIFE